MFFLNKRRKPSSLRAGSVTFRRFLLLDALPQDCDRCAADDPGKQYRLHRAFFRCAGCGSRVVELELATANAFLAFDEARERHLWQAIHTSKWTWYCSPPNSVSSVSNAAHMVQKILPHFKRCSPWNTLPQYLVTNTRRAFSIKTQSLPRRNTLAQPGQ